MFLECFQVQLGTVSNSCLLWFFIGRKESNECSLQGTAGEGVGKPSVVRPHIRGPYPPTPDVQSLWSYV